MNQWNHKVFNVKEQDFEAVALELFRFQAANNTVYRDFIAALQIDPAAVRSLTQVPFLPIRFFKSHDVTTGTFEPALVFESSGTTGSINSRHLVRDAAIYEESFTRCFHRFYGAPSGYCIIGLLPSYLERQHSSLVYMVNRLIHDSQHPSSGFYLHDLAALSNTLQALAAVDQTVLLIGVSFALLDFAEAYPQQLTHVQLMETGGMKGRREELIRPALHVQLQEAFGLPAIHSEYGMTELLSQAYSKGDGLFETPAWMKVMVRDEEDPLTVRSHGNGLINIIDLANIYSCAFIATDDIGRIHHDGRFEVLGRADGSDLRGCSLMVAAP